MLGELQMNGGHHDAVSEFVGKIQQQNSVAVVTMSDLSDDEQL